MSHYTSLPAEFTLGKIRILGTEGGGDFAKLTFRMARCVPGRTVSGRSKRALLLQEVCSWGHLKRFGSGPMNIGTLLLNMLRFDAAYQSASPSTRKQFSFDKVIVSIDNSGYMSEITQVVYG